MAIPSTMRFLQTLLPNWDTLSAIQSPHPGHMPHIDFSFRAMETAVCKVLLSSAPQEEVQPPGSRKGADRAQLRFNGKVWGSLLQLPLPVHRTGMPGRLSGVSPPPQIPAPGPPQAPSTSLSSPFLTPDP